MSKHIGLAAILIAIGAPAFADITALVVTEPTARKDVLMLSTANLESGLAKQVGQTVKVTVTEDLTDAMRTTRSAGFDIFIAPPQVAASALAHGYEIVGSTDAEEQYVLVGAISAKSAADVRQGRMYLPQQDSIYTYLARGMLTANGLSFKDLQTVTYARYPQAGLSAISIHLSDATVVRRADWEAWDKDNRGVTKVLATSGAVPGGLSVAVKKDLPADTRARIARWFVASAPSCGLKPVVQHADGASYKRVAEWGSFTPTSLPGATVVNAETVKKLMAQGVPVIDTRNDQEFKQKHIPGARLVPYVEKSLKDVAYEGKLDDFSGLATLDKTVPTIFQCNGPECWKSYKASRAAITAGFTKVYWFRGGMPEWNEANP
jgi:rhodanese-related sulfurtransferase/ABC-type phosphate/phosphonate transport system substrate-binding protein